MHLLPLPVRAVLCLDDRLVEKIREIIDVNIRAENHVAAAAAIAAIGSAFRHEFLAPKTHTTAPAVPSLGQNFDPIDEHKLNLAPAIFRRAPWSVARSPATRIFLPPACARRGRIFRRVPD